jgi:hypothetical protein
MEIKEEILLTFYGADVPFITKRGNKYFINDALASNQIIAVNNETEYLDDPEILLNAIKNAKPTVSYSNAYYKTSSKEEFWQEFFNYMYSGKGDLILWHNPSSVWRTELCRRNVLKCDKCNNLMILYYVPTCYHCDKPNPDKKGNYDLIPVCYWIALKNNLKYDFIWRLIGNQTDFIVLNKISAELKFTGNDEIDKYLKMIDDEFPFETTIFYVSW